MTVRVVQLSGLDAYDLIYPDHLAKLSDMAQESMHRAMRNSSHVWIGFDGSFALVAYGLIPPTLLSDRAYLWLYTTEHIQSHIFSLIRHSQRAIEEMLREYPLIVGHGVVGADRSLRWLRWLGAEFGPPQGNLLPFTIKASSQWPQVSAQSA